MLEPQQQHIHIADIQKHTYHMAYPEQGMYTSPKPRKKEKPIGITSIQLFAKAGVAVLVHEELQRHINQIERIGRRALGITLANRKATMQIAILATYAPPHGYTVEKKQHWILARETVKQIPITNLCV